MKHFTLDSHKVGILKRAVRYNEFCGKNNIQVNITGAQVAAFVAVSSNQGGPN